MTTGPGAFYDGGSSDALEAAITVSGEALIVSVPGRPPIEWPRAAVQVDTGSVAGGPARISMAGASGLVITADRAVLAALGRREQSGASALGQGLLLLVSATVAVLAAGYFLFLPWIAGVLARRVPVSIEQQLGRVALEQLAPAAQRCEDEKVRKPVRAIVDKLARVAPQMGYPFQVYVVNDKQVNAFATPGGYVVVYTGLLDKTGSPEELAAVLAHEVTHVTGRHGTVGLMRGMVFWVLLSYLIGDPTGVLVQAAGALSQLSYQRGQEEEADRGAMQLFEKAHIDPKGLTRAFEMLGKETPELPAAARYFSTHPRTEDRLAGIRKWERSADYRAEPLPDAEGRWPPRGSCGL